MTDPDLLVEPRDKGTRRQRLGAHDGKTARRREGGGSSTQKKKKLKNSFCLKTLAAIGLLSFEAFETVAGMGRRTRRLNAHSQYGLDISSLLGLAGPLLLVYPSTR